jgi:hypothetical protein
LGRPTHHDRRHDTAHAHLQRGGTPDRVMVALRIVPGPMRRHMMRAFVSAAWHDVGIFAHPPDSASPIGNVHTGHGGGVVTRCCPARGDGARVWLALKGAGVQAFLLPATVDANRLMHCAQRRRLLH